MSGTTDVSRDAGAGGRVRAMIAVTRPGQWVKNLLVLVGFFFALGDRLQTVRVGSAWVRISLAVVLFCLVSGAAYIMNDWHDREADRRHPDKRDRPIASGRLAGFPAAVEAIVLLVVAMALGLWIGVGFAVCLACYFVLQVLYTHMLKDQMLVELFVIALGFVIRVYAGTRAAGVPATAWLLGCTFMAALLMILCKRYHEKTVLGDQAGAHRAVLDRYEPVFLTHLISVSAACTILCYALYTLAPQTVEKFGTDRMIVTVPFVVFGIFRYLYLVLCRGQGGRPERTLTRDRPLVINLLLYVATCLFVVHAMRFVPV